ncbi:hypothetical protein HU200_008516 [Digitaria exilis]|uniref:Uncharacterized protein n=1 Tax=Digitaria exilis TaxID=1010633 RepID=A0A835KQ52_9POAL|nr:hypothetical protein HU200_008516 [Digitaria exilis]
MTRYTACMRSCGFAVCKNEPALHEAPNRYIGVRGDPPEPCSAPAATGAEPRKLTTTPSTTTTPPANEITGASTAAATTRQAPSSAPAAAAVTGMSLLAVAGLGGVALLAWWTLAFRRDNAMLWMVPAGLVLLGTPLLAWFSVLASGPAKQPPPPPPLASELATAANRLCSRARAWFSFSPAMSMAQCSAGGQLLLVAVPYFPAGPNYETLSLLAQILRSSPLLVLARIAGRFDLPKSLKAFVVVVVIPGPGHAFRPVSKLIYLLHYSPSSENTNTIEPAWPDYRHGELSPRCGNGGSLVKERNVPMGHGRNRPVVHGNGAPPPSFIPTDFSFLHH